MITIRGVSSISRDFLLDCALLDGGSFAFCRMTKMLLPIIVDDQTSEEYSIRAFDVGSNLYISRHDPSSCSGISSCIIFIINNKQKQYHLEDISLGFVFVSAPRYLTAEPSIASRLLNR